MEFNTQILRKIFFFKFQVLLENYMTVICAGKNL